MATIESGTATQDWKVRAGTTLATKFQLKDGDGVVIDITGYTIRVTARKSHNKEPVIIELDNDTLGGITLTDPTNGIFHYAVSAATTAAINSNKEITNGVWDMELEDPSGNVDRYMEGSFEFSPEVSK